MPTNMEHFQHKPAQLQIWNPVSDDGNGNQTRNKKFVLEAVNDAEGGKLQLLAQDDSTFEVTGGGDFKFKLAKKPGIMSLALRGDAQVDYGAMVDHNTKDLAQEVFTNSMYISMEHSRALLNTSASNASVDTEKSRAMSVEASISAVLATETSIARSTEVSISADLATETSKAIVLKNTVDSNQRDQDAIELSLSTETSHARSAEVSISAALGTAETSISTEMSTETSRAKYYEAALSQEYSTERSRAKSVESSISVVLVTETSIARSTEVSISAVLATETSIARSAESSIANDLGTETSIARSAEVSISAVLATETSRATSAELSCSQRLDEILDNDDSDKIDSFREMVQAFENEGTNVSTFLNGAKTKIDDIVHVLNHVFGSHYVKCISDDFATAEGTVAATIPVGEDAANWSKVMINAANQPLFSPHEMSDFTDTVHQGGPDPNASTGP